MTEKQCRGCNVVKPITEFLTVRVTKRLKDGSRSTWTGPHSKCRACKRARQRTDHSRNLCAARAAKRRALNPELRRQEQKRKAEKAGRMYRTRQEITRETAKQRAAIAARSAKRQERTAFIRSCIGKYLASNPEGASLPNVTLRYRAMYAHDAQFRAKEILRLHRRKNMESNGEQLLDDGSLTPQALCNLFGQAKCCPYCERTMRSEDKTLDHVWPRSLGGWHSIRNAVVCCRSCNAKKRGRTPDTWLALLPSDRRITVQQLYDRVTGNRSQPWLVAS